MILVGVGPQPADGRLAILDLRRKAIARCRPIIGTDGHVTASGQHLDGLLHLLAIAADPTAAVNTHHGREWSFAVPRHRQVELQLRGPALAEDHVVFQANRYFALLSRRRNRQRSQGHSGGDHHDAKRHTRTSTHRHSSLSERTASSRAAIGPSATSW